MARTSRLLGALGLLLALMGLGAVATARTVASAEMSPELKPGDTVWLLPLPVIRGDLVALRDPLDPERVVLRRAIAGPGQKVRYEDGQIRIEVKLVRQKDMGQEGAVRFLEETMWSKPPARANTWVIQRQSPDVAWEHDAYTVPEGSWYLLADDRDRALDSRWWGPIPESDFLGVVRLRYGPADAWRPGVEILRPIP